MMTSREKSALLSSLRFAPRKKAFAGFFDFDIEGFERMLREEGETFWERQGAKRALAFFHATAKRVPAYRDFLRRNRVRHERIKTIADFARVPITDKKNYIHAYPLAARCWDGALTQADLIAASSGTSGAPTFWPRAGFQEHEAAIIHELLYRYLFDIKKYKTLLVIGFPVGIYVSGVATLIPSRLVSEKGYPLTIVSVGNNKSDILRLIRELKEEFEQVILVGHPFFIKDVIETGAQERMGWAKTRLRLMFCSEGFSEAWRRYVIHQAKIPFSWRAAISTYGSSEFLLMAHETPMSILARSIAETNAKFRDQLFDAPSALHLFQYNPYMRYIEERAGELLFTSASGIPLVRFNLRDGGKLFSFSRVREVLDKTMPHWQRELSKSGDAAAVWQLPFLALSGRSDQTVIFYAANIYPDHIRIALDHKPFFKHLTGKFTLRKAYTKAMDEFLEVHIELRKGITSDAKFAAMIRAHLVAKLQEINMEYRDTHHSHPSKDLRPRVKLWPYQHAKYFKPGLKPKYIARE